MRRVLRPGLRGRLHLTVTLGVAVLIAALTAGFNLALSARLDRDATDLARARAASGLTAVRLEDGRLTVPEAPDDRSLGSLGWVFAGRRVLEAPHAQARTTAAARALVLSGGRTADVNDTRLYAAPVRQGGRRVGTVVSGVSLEPYERTAHAALVGSLLLAVALWAVLALAARWLISGALGPVVRMTGQAADWSERDLDRRFALGPPRDEFTRLAATLDGLLDRLAASLRREQRFSAELSHELRTPLAGLIAEAQLALRHERSPGEYRGALEGILDSAHQMARTLETLVAATRAELGAARGTSEARDGVRAAAEACSAAAERRGVKVEVADSGAPVRVGAEQDVVERILSPLIENGCRYGDGNVKVAIERNGTTVTFRVRDDGPGVTASEAETIFEPGSRGEAGRSANEGAGLGLALSRRLAHAARGEVEAVPDGTGGHFSVRLPAA
jgi:two-component system, OmpR family, sensor kinase